MRESELRWVVWLLAATNILWIIAAEMWRKKYEKLKAQKDGHG